MAQIHKIRKTVASITATRKITSAMEMVAASKMRKAQQRMREARPYADRILEVVQRVAAATPQYLPVLMRQRQPDRCAWILVSTDKGLCGGLNQNLFRLFLKHMQEQLAARPDMTPSACALGRKAEVLCRRLKLPFISTSKLGELPAVASVLNAIHPLLKDFQNGDLDRIYLVRNRFVNTVSQEPNILQLAPVEPPEKSEHTESSMPWDYIYEPEPEELMDRLLQRYVEAQVHEAVIENNACEQAAKMVAMKSASDNAGDMIDQLQLAYNNARQAAITAELADIIGGAEAV